MTQRIIGITLGDPAGIGPEVVVKALRKSTACKMNKVKIIGDACVFTHYISKMRRNWEFIDLKSVSEAEFKIGKSTPMTSRASLDYLHKAIELLRGAEITSLVTAPVSKEAIGSLGQEFVGHTEFLANIFGAQNVQMMFVAPSLRTVIVTRHLALNKVSKSITEDHVYSTIVSTHQSITEHFKILNPRIAVCGLNPHAGEGGSIGQEEIKIIIPAIKRARAARRNIAGPYSADTLFCPMVSEKYDAIVAMYHDQGMIPMKALYFDHLVNLTTGLPFVRTSPAHGTAMDIAGQDKANPSSMIAAIELAAQLS